MKRVSQNVCNTNAFSIAKRTRKSTISSYFTEKGSPLSSTLADVERQKKMSSEESDHECSPKFLECHEIMKNIIDLNDSAVTAGSCSAWKMNQDGSSWILHVSGYKKASSQKVFQSSWAMHPEEKKYLGKLYGKPCYENRYSQSYGSIAYSYSGYREEKNDTRPISDDPILSELVHDINKVVSSKRGPYNGCLTNWYLPEHSIAAHADDEKQLKSESPIFSLSWGGPRRFLVKPKKNCKYAYKREFLVEDGDLLVMGGILQITHKHEVPKWRKTKDPYVPGPRINWTVRAFHEENGI